MSKKLIQKLQQLFDKLPKGKERKVKIKVSDSGLRGKFNGELYVDKKVFFKRADVRAVIKSLKESIALKEHIEENKKELE